MHSKVLVPCSILTPFSTSRNLADSIPYAFGKWAERRVLVNELVVRRPRWPDQYPTSWDPPTTTKAQSVGTDRGGITSAVCQVFVFSLFGNDKVLR